MRIELSFYIQSSASLPYILQVMNDDDMYKMVVYARVKEMDIVVSTMGLGWGRGGGQCELIV